MEEKNTSTTSDGGCLLLVVVVIIVVVVRAFVVNAPSNKKNVEAPTQKMMHIYDDIDQNMLEATAAAIEDEIRLATEEKAIEKYGDWRSNSDWEAERMAATSDAFEKILRDEAKNETEKTPRGYTCDQCIKGNISLTSGEKIYHLPGCENYEDTVINVRYGERWFSSEEDAIAAGWRKAYNCP